MRTRYLLSFCIGMLALVGCDKELDLAHKYNNETSRLPYVEDEESTDGWLEKDKLFLSERTDINVKDNIPRKGYWLDGKISVAKFSWAADFSIFWSADASFMQERCSSPYLEQNINSLSNSDIVIGNTVNPIDGFTDGGQWFIGVHEIPGEKEKLVGFFHAESHWKGQNGAYKSIGVAYSDDHGKTWTAGERILSGTDPKPATSKNDGTCYGLGDGCVVWNEKRQSWICYYSGYSPDGNDYVMCMAESKDPRGAAGTWKKWDGTDFTGEGCNQSTQLGDVNRAIAGINSWHGANPSVMYNTYLEKWIMVYHCWNTTIIYSESEDGIEWSKGETIIDKSMEPGGAMYPNLVGIDGDLTGGKQFRLYYSADMVNGVRVFTYRKVSLK